MFPQKEQDDKLYCMGGARDWKGLVHFPANGDMVFAGCVDSLSPIGLTV